MENKIESLLCNLGICDPESIVPFYSKVRDRDDVSVLKCEKSGVIFLSRSDHVEISHYEEMSIFNYWGKKNCKEAINSCLEDNYRRYHQFSNIIANKIWLDVGTGAGGLLELLSPIASRTLAVEPQNESKKYLIDNGYEVYSQIEEVPIDNLDIVTMFHVFEHFIDPLTCLKIIKEKMKKGGKLIIEVPHANDFLITFLELESFKAFTFFSEHLILHTRNSLHRFLEVAKFQNICISGFQRYPLANHLYWLAKGNPGGHVKWNQLRTKELDSAYANMLNSLDKTDTLIAIAEA